MIDRLLPWIPLLLSSAGICYMVVVEENKPEEIAGILKDKYSMVTRRLARRRERNELLSVLKISRE